RIHLHGADQSNGDPTVQAQGAVCRSEELDPGQRPCGINPQAWDSNGMVKGTMPGAGGFKDYFYQYDPLLGDGKKDALGR
ncbi:hypothetical protein ABTH25_19935, partial [Acinetobacter baumannii]